MYYLIVVVLLFWVELFYFWLADLFNIIDQPNEQSSHGSRCGGHLLHRGFGVFHGEWRCICGAGDDLYDDVCGGGVLFLQFP